MIPRWEKRPEIVSNLLNPAFCGEVIRLAVKSYKDESQKPFPFALFFLILPIVLNKKTRESLPKTTATKFFEWLENNVEIKIHLANQIKNLTPYTREAVLFLIFHNKLLIQDDGNFSLIQSRNKKINYTNNEIAEIYNKSKMLGKWLAKSGNIQTIYALIGIKP